MCCICKLQSLPLKSFQSNGKMDMQIKYDMHAVVKAAGDVTSIQRMR